MLGEKTEKKKKCKANIADPKVVTFNAKAWRGIQIDFIIVSSFVLLSIAFARSRESFFFHSFVFVSLIVSLVCVDSDRKKKSRNVNSPLLTRRHDTKVIMKIDKTD